MGFSTKVAEALAEYDNTKSLHRRLRGSHPAIVAMKALPGHQQYRTTFLIKCFLDHPVTDDKHPAYQVYQAVLSYIHPHPASNIDDAVAALKTLMPLLNINKQKNYPWH